LLGTLKAGWFDGQYRRLTRQLPGHSLGSPDGNTE
jgi:hypothetical protein